MSFAQPPKPPIVTDEAFEILQTALKNRRYRSPAIWEARDATAAILFHIPPGKESRFRLGLVSWLLWIARVIFFDKKTSLKFHVSSEPPKFAFYVLGNTVHSDTLFPMIREAATVGDKVTVWGDPLPEVRQWIKTKRNISIIPFGDGNFFGSGIQIARDAAKGFLEAILLLAIPGLGVSRRTLIKRFSEIAEAFFKYANFQRFWNAQPLPEEALFVSFELLLEVKSLVHIARERGLRVVHFMHGFPHAFYQVTQSTDLCALSRRDEEWFRARVEVDCKVWCIGNPRFEEVRLKVPPRRERQAGEPLRLLFFSQPAEAAYTREIRANDYRILSADRVSFTLRVRPHPRESIELLQEDWDAAGVAVDAWSIGSLAEDIAWADAVASSWSTANFEGAISERGVFWICSHPESFGVGKQMSGEGLGLLISTQKEWKDACRDFLAGDSSSPAFVTESKLRELGFIGHSGETFLERLGIRK